MTPTSKRNYIKYSIEDKILEDFEFETDEPSLTILIATMGKRNKSFLSLLDSLLPQIDRLGGKVEVVAYWNNGELSIGQIRQALLEEAKGNYICFVDDDDELPPYYCYEIINALGKDYVGFNVKVLSDEIEKPTAFHSIRYQTWHQDENGYYRGVTHLNPVKRGLALMGRFDGGVGEDERWARTVTPFVKTENYLDKIMYIYHHSSENSNFGGDKKEGQFKRPIIVNKQFRWHPESRR